jgi:hypothetical protein
MIFNAQTYHPALGPDNTFSVESTLMPRQFWPMASVFFEYANQPIRLTIQPSGELYAATVTGMFTAHLMPGIGLTRWMSVALDLPVVLYQGFDSRTPTSDVPLLPTTAGLGDLRIMTKFRLINNENGGFGLAATPEFSLPTGSVNSLRGEGTFGIEPRLAADYRFKNGIFIALNLGFFIRTYNTDVDFGLVRKTHELRYGLGLGIPVSKAFSLLGELVGAASFDRLAGGPFYTPLEGYVGARYTSKSGFEVAVGGGSGMVNAVGSPNLRLMLSLSYTPRGTPPPKVVESVEPVSDVTLTKPKTNDDPDGDGIAGSADLCPNDPGPADSHGCPDSDKDGIIDKFDKCPKEAGPASNSGCPTDSSDTDRDGVLDRHDKCPLEAGPVENEGCPDKDQDNDGVVDRLDKCPSDVGPKENDGCPLLDIKAVHIKLARPIRWKPGTASLEPESKAVVEALAKAINDDESIKKVSIQVTASGTKKEIKKLTPKRALTLFAALIEADVARKKIKIKASKRPGDDEITRIDIQRGKVRGAHGHHAKKERVKKAKSHHHHHRHHGKSDDE